MNAVETAEARLRVLELAIPRARPDGEARAYLEARGRPELLDRPTIGGMSSLEQYRQLRHALRALVHGASPALRRTIATVETISPTFAALGDDQ